jgi:hypothetical protein
MLLGFRTDFVPPSVLPFTNGGVTQARSKGSHQSISVTTNKQGSNSNMKPWLIVEPQSRAAALNIVEDSKEIARKANGIFR